MERINRPFDLATDVLLRATLLRLAPGEHVLCLVVHHIVADGWSMGPLFAELTLLYSGQSLPPLPGKYADVARWQREHGRATENLAETNLIADDFEVTRFRKIDD